MKVYISNYRNHWISPYTIFDYMFFWTDWSKCSRNKSLKYAIEEMNIAKNGGVSTYVEHPEWVDRWTDRLVPVCQAIQWFLNLVRPRIQYVKVDRWDTWSMDHTLGIIALPMLKQLKDSKHGAPNVDDEDVPKELRSIYSLPKEECETDGNHFKRWDWVLDEMIFAFEHSLDDSWEEQYRSGVIDYKSEPCNWDDNGKPVAYKQVDGPNHTYKCDYDGMRVVQDRIQNGFRLFGKYYQSLWD